MLKLNLLLSSTWKLIVGPYPQIITVTFFLIVAAVSRFPSRGSRDLWLSLEAFPRSFPTGLSHVQPLCVSMLGLKVEAVQGKQVSLEWTEISGGLWEW